MELQVLYPAKTILKFFARLSFKKAAFPLYWSFAID